MADMARLQTVSKGDAARFTLHATTRESIERKERPCRRVQAFESRNPTLWSPLSLLVLKRAAWCV